MSNSDSLNSPPESTPKNKRRGGRGGVRSELRKAAQVDPQAREDVLALLGDAPRRRDLLIEHLHKIQDRYGCLSAPHLVALAAEMKMAMAEVYEVATFYHHFDVVKEGDTAAAGDHGPRLRFDRLRSRRFARAAGETARAARHRRARAARAVRRPLRDRAGRSRRPESDPARDRRAGDSSRCKPVRSNAPQRNGRRHARPHRLRGVSRGRRICAGRVLHRRGKEARRRHRGDGRLRSARPRRRRLSRRPQVEDWSRPNPRRA